MVQQLRAVTLWTLISCLSLVGADDIHCVLDDQKTGKAVDLRPLALVDSSWKAISTDGHDYYMNVCAGLKGMDSMSEGCMPEDDPSIAICQDKKDEDGNTVDRFPKILGSATEGFAEMFFLNPEAPDKGVTVTYTNGEGNNETSCHKAYMRKTTIQFNCVEGSGMGNPVFISEGEACEFRFQWETEFACLRDLTQAAEPVVACTGLNAQGDVIDLQPLAKADSDWLVGYETFLFHLNLCHGLKGDFSGDCKTKASGCQTGADGLEKSLGWAETPKAQDEEGVSIEFKNGTHCHQNKPKEGPRTTKIVFHCDETAGLGEPKFTAEDDGDHGSGCLYLFEWTTAAACPPLQPISGNCSVYDPVDEYTYDLSQLRSSTGYELMYELPDKSTHTYSVNICGVNQNCKDNSSAACLVKDGPITPIGRSSSALQYNHGNLWLSYDTKIPCGDANKSVDIIFLCDEMATVDKTISTSSHMETFFRVQNEPGSEGCSHLLEFQTNLACGPQEKINCVIQDSDTGSVYDLSPLASSTGAWSSFSEGNSDAKFMLNLCEPVQTDGLCGPSQGACQMFYEDEKPVKANNLGRLSKPVLVNSTAKPGEKVLVLEYVGGTLCHTASEDRLTRSTHINVYCKPDAGIGEPVFVNEDNCHYNFEWYSAAACPLAANGTTGFDCSVRDPRTGQTFDFSSLASKTDYKATDTNTDQEYLFNICKPAKCDNKYGACQQKVGGGSSKGIGVASGNLSVADDVVHLTYTGGVGNCHGKFDRSLQINFACPTTETMDGDIAFLEEDSDCGYFVQFTTNLACTSQSFQCEVTSPTGTVYDLTRLMITDGGNFQTSNPTTGDLFEINICRSLVATTTKSGCPLQSGACLRQIDTSVPASSTPIGLNIGLPSAPTWDAETGHPVVDYKDGTGGNSTHIVFICPGQDDSRSGLEFGSVICDNRESSADCIHMFTFYTGLVCDTTSTDDDQGNNGGLHDNDIVKGIGCKVTDPVSGFTLDFSDMAGSPWPRNNLALTDPGGHGYQLAICSDSGLTCGDDSTDGNTMACQVGDSSFSLGGAEDKGLELINGVPRITYSGGKPCHVGKATESVRGASIEFRCHPSAGLGYPVFRNETDSCKYEFVWETERACLPQYSPFDCRVDDGQNFFDLSALSKHDANWKIDDLNDVDSDTYYEINVCRALVPSVDSKCNQTAGACQTIDQGDKRFSLGLVTAPKINADGKVVLIYEGGDRCHNDKYARGLMIEFECPRDGAGRAIAGVTETPVYLAETEDCKYKFTWRTSAACPIGESTVPLTPTSCRVSSNSGQSFDLNPLKDKQFSTKSADEAFKYTLQFCGGNLKLDQECSGAGACQTDISANKLKSLGQATGLTYGSAGLRIEFENGTKCHNNLYTRSATVDFKCDSSKTDVDSASLEFVSEHADCTYEFILHTAMACEEEEMECSILDLDTGSKYDLSALRKSDANWIAPSGDADGDSEQDEYWYEINVCRGLVSNPTWHEKGSSRCIGKGACQVSDTTAHSVGVSGSKSSSLGIVDGKLVLKYMNGSDCSNDDRRQTVIEFECSPTPGDIGRPIFVAEETHCVYKFAWTTSYACPIGGDAVVPPPPPPPTASGDLPPCWATDARSGRVYNLTNLKPATDISSSRFYEGVIDEEKFHISPCGHQSCGSGPKNTAVCNSDRKVGGLFTTAPEFVGEDLVITYAGDKVHGEHEDDCDAVGSKVTFKCDWSPPTTNVKYLGLNEEDCVHQFEWYTPRVCAGSQQLECVVNYGNVEYDLTPLIHSAAQGNWVVDTSAALTMHESLKINMCRQLSNPVTDCIDAAVCHGDTGKFEGVGYLHSEPVIAGGAEGNDDENVIKVWYPGRVDEGDNCGTMVVLVCQHGSLGSPSLTLKQGCYYEITWESSVACKPSTEPVLDNGKGEDCTVQTDVSGSWFDLRPLQALKPAELSVPTGTEGEEIQISLSVCGAIEGTRCNSDKSAICDRNGNSWGQANSNPMYLAESLVLEYRSGDQCDESEAYAVHSTMIKFVCNEYAELGSPTYDTTLSTACKHVFLWETEQACSHVDEYPCLLTNNRGEEFDLSPLKRINSKQGNWILTGEKDSYEYEMNVCQGLNQDSTLQVDRGTSCPHGSALCQFEINSKNAKSLGTVGNPYFDTDGTIIMKLMNGDPCSNNRNRETIVKFTCNKEAGIGEPTFTGETDHCVYTVEWATEFACAVEKPTAGTDDCHIANAGGMSLSLAQLGERPAIIGSTNTKPEFELAVCGARTSNCNRGNACVKETINGHTHWYSLGKSTNIVASTNGRSLSMATKNGDLCPDGKSKRSSTISFVCNDKAGTDSKPQLMRASNDCSYSFMWETPLACGGTPMRCTVFNTKTKSPIYLGVLKGNLKPFKNKGVDYHLSLCDPEDNSPCMKGSRLGRTEKAGSGMCAVVNSKPVSLGEMKDTVPTIADNGDITVTYAGGDDCRDLGSIGDKGSGPSKSEITFVCARYGKEIGSPTLLSGPTSNDCTFKFKWETCAICPGSNPCEGKLPTAKPTARPNSSPTRKPTKHPANGNGDDSSSSDTNGGGGGTAGVVILSLLLIGGLVYYLKDAARRDKVRSMIGLTSSSTPRPHRYKSLNNDYDDDNSITNNLLYNSDGDSEDKDEDDDVLTGGGNLGGKVAEDKFPSSLSDNNSSDDNHQGTSNALLDDDDDENLLDMG